MPAEAAMISRRAILEQWANAVGVACSLTSVMPELLRGSGAESSRLGVVILLGPPGAGKSEQSRRLAAHHMVPIVSTGDLLRDHVRPGTKLGFQADAYMKAGQLVPDSLMSPILEERVEHPDCKSGFILDGYPPTLAQVESLDPLLKLRRLPSHVFLLEVPTERLMKLLTGRRICPRCNRTYNIYFQPPKKENLCDADETPLVQRADDKEEVIRRRLETYQKEIPPVIEYYAREGRLVRIRGDRPPGSVGADIEAKLASR